MLFKHAVFLFIIINQEILFKSSWYLVKLTTEPIRINKFYPLMDGRFQMSGLPGWVSWITFASNFYSVHV